MKAKYSVEKSRAKVCIRFQLYRVFNIFFFAYYGFYGKSFWEIIWFFKRDYEGESDERGVVPTDEHVGLMRTKTQKQDKGKNLIYLFWDFLT